MGSIEEQGTQAPMQSATLMPEVGGKNVKCERPRASVALESSVSFLTMTIPEIMGAFMSRDLKVRAGHSASLQPSDEDVLDALQTTRDALNSRVQEGLVKTEADLSTQVETLENESLEELRELEICERGLGRSLHDMNTTLSFHNGVEGIPSEEATFEEHMCTMIASLEQQDEEVESLIIRWKDNQQKILQSAITMLSPDCLQADEGPDQSHLRESLETGTQAHGVSSKQMAEHYNRLGVLSERMRSLCSETERKLNEYQKVSICKAFSISAYTNIQNRTRRTSNRN